MRLSNSDQPEWQPPFCPNPNCRYHKALNDHWRFRKIGFYLRRCRPRRIQRFLCICCRRSFSRQTFSSTYWQKLPQLDQQIFMKTVGGMANRQIARDLGVAPTTIDRHIGRLGRHSLLFHRRLMNKTTAKGPVAIDSFESFELSQYFPFQHHVAVEVDTGFFLHFTDSPLRRKGRMTAYQKYRRQQLEQMLGRPDPKTVSKDITELLEVSLQGLETAIVLSDEHTAYPKAIRSLSCQVHHQVTSSRQRRDAHNPLFEINLLDLMIRHSSANHKRETIAWSKRRQSSAERLAIFLVWRNYLKKRREKGQWVTPAMLKGLLAKPIAVQEILSRRLFRTRIALPGRWSEYYDRQVVTRGLRINRRHNLKYAY